MLIACSLALFFLLHNTFLAFAAGEQDLTVNISVEEGDRGKGIVLFTLTNTSRFTLHVLQWNTPLEGEFRSDTFIITLGRKKVRYIGKLVKRSQAQPSDYAVLMPGESVAAKVSLTTGYDIQQAGEYEVMFNSFIEYMVMDPATKYGSKHKKIRSNKLLLTIDVVEQPPVAAKVAPIFYSCSTDRMIILDSALSEAEKYAQKSAVALQTLVEEERTTAQRYTAWFGSYTDWRYDTVNNNFARMAAALADEPVEFRCDCTEDYLAYVYTDEPYVIHLCNQYWEVPLIGTDSQAGTIIHEMSHFTTVAGTVDYVYGQENALELAATYPDDAVDNADNHEYFSENNPFLPMAPVYLPDNTFANAPIAGKVPVYAMVSSVGTDKELGEPVHAGNSGGSSVWLTWTAPASGMVEVSTLGSSFDTLLAVYTGDEVANLSLVAENDDADSATYVYQSFVTLMADAGLTYRIAVDGYGGDAGNVYLTVSAILADIDHDGGVTLADTILALQVVSDQQTSNTLSLMADVNNDGKIGMAEAIYSLQKVAGLR